MGEIKEGVARKCPFCDTAFYNMEQYGNHKKRVQRDHAKERREIEVQKHKKK